MYFLYRVFCNVGTYVSCREYDGTLKSARLQSVNQGGTTDNKLFVLGRNNICQGFFYSKTRRKNNEIKQRRF